jgi:hypothetical protein
MRMQLRQGNPHVTLIHSNSKFVFCLFVLSINIHNGIQGMKMVAKIFVSITNKTFLKVEKEWVSKTKREHLNALVCNQFKVLVFKY